jgi:hypothetical protein
VLDARGIKGVSNFGAKLRLADTAEGDDRGELNEQDFAQLMKEEKLGLTPSDVKVIFERFDLSVEDGGAHRLDYEDFLEQVKDWEIIADPEPDLLALVEAAALPEMSQEERQRAARSRQRATRSDLQGEVEDKIRQNLAVMEQEELRKLRKGRILRRKARAKSKKKKAGGKYLVND